MQALQQRLFNEANEGGKGIGEDDAVREVSFCPTFMEDGDAKALVHLASAS